MPETVTEIEETAIDETADAPGEATPGEPAAADDVVAHRAEFPAMSAGKQTAGLGSLQRFFDVTVTVSVELGRATLPIGELVKLGQGSVIELDRAVSEPVDLVAQGVRLARGEVIVVNDRYAIRIQEVDGGRTDEASSAARTRESDGAKPRI